MGNSEGGAAFRSEQAGNGSGRGSTGASYGWARQTAPAADRNQPPAVGQIRGNVLQGRTRTEDSEVAPGFCAGRVGGDAGGRRNGITGSGLVLDAGTVRASSAVAAGNAIGEGPVAGTLVNVRSAG